jgi:glycosyltransferase involved in cell wall biosynthesis
MQISVIIPTHNRAPLLTRALNSVLAQTHAPLEIILVDDGSTDETPQLAADHFPQVRYIFQPNRGVSAARNRGMEAASGEWLAFLDSDDEWLPDKLANQVEAIEADPVMRICHTEEIWVRNGKRVNPMKKHAKSGGRIYRNCLPLCVISPSSVMVHRSIFDEVGPFDDSLPACEDYDLWLRICAGHPVAFVETPQIVKYGGHEDQLSQRHWGMDRFRVRALEKMIAGGSLGKTDLSATARTLVDKAAILAGGAEKRGKQEEAEHYSAIRERYRNLL